MKAIISTTYSDSYLYFLPIVTGCWNTLGVGVVLFLPETKNENEKAKLQLGFDAMNYGYNQNEYHFFKAPEHKQATYAQCSRLFAGCLDFPDEEILVTSDIDMANFCIPPYVGGFTVFGSDLVPSEQRPMCYISAKAKDWKRVFSKGRTYQDCLDQLVGVIECEHFRGNQWSLDQWTAYHGIPEEEIKNVPRAREGTQFASHRSDRDDYFWRERVTPDLVDAHLWRPGYEPANFANLMELLQMMNPYSDFSWIFEYTEQYKRLL